MLIKISLSTRWFRFLVMALSLINEIFRNIVIRFILIIQILTFLWFFVDSEETEQIEPKTFFFWSFSIFIRRSRCKVQIMWDKTILIFLILLILYLYTLCITLFRRAFSKCSLFLLIVFITLLRCWKYFEKSFVHFLLLLLLYLLGRFLDLGWNKCTLDKFFILSYLRNLFIYIFSQQIYSCGCWRLTLYFFARCRYFFRSKSCWFLFNYFFVCLIFLRLSSHIEKIYCIDLCFFCLRVRLFWKWFGHIGFFIWSGSNLLVFRRNYFFLYFFGGHFLLNISLLLFNRIFSFKFRLVNFLHLLQNISQSLIQIFNCILLLIIEGTSFLGKLKQNLWFVLDQPHILSIHNWFQILLELKLRLFGKLFNIIQHHLSWIITRSIILSFQLFFEIIVGFDSWMIWKYHLPVSQMFIGSDK